MMQLPLVDMDGTCTPPPLDRRGTHEGLRRTPGRAKWAMKSAKVYSETDYHESCPSPVVQIMDVLIG